jgi:hypothetical protein
MASTSQANFTMFKNHQSVPHSSQNLTVYKQTLNTKIYKNYNLVGLTLFVLSALRGTGRQSDLELPECRSEKLSLGPSYFRNEANQTTAVQVFV